MSKSINVWSLPPAESEAQKDREYEQRQRERERIDENRRRAKLLREAKRSGQRLTDGDVEKKVGNRSNLDFECGVHRLVWKPGPSGLLCYFQRIPCNGARGEGHPCCYLCSQWLQSHDQLLREWFGLAYTVERKAANWLRQPNAFRLVWPVPFE